MKKALRFILIINMALTIFLTGCTKDDFFYESIDFLTSDECAGRFVGTEGNKKAEEYIINALNPSFTLGDYELSYNFTFDLKNNGIDNPEMEKAYKLEPTLDKIDLINLQFFTYNEDKMKCFYGELSKLPNDPQRKSRFTDKDSAIQIIEEVGAIDFMMEFVNRIEE